MCEVRGGKTAPRKNKPAFKLGRNDSLLATLGQSQPQGGRRRREGVWNLLGSCLRGKGSSPPATL